MREPARPQLQSPRDPRWGRAGPAGLLLDFKLLKHVLRPVIDRIDHQMLNELEPFTVLNPSAENLAKYFYDQTNQQLAEMTQGRVRVKDAPSGRRIPRPPLTTNKAWGLQRSRPVSADQFIWLDFDFRYLSKGISK